jgi:hypothetical protein
MNQGGKSAMSIMAETNEKSKVFQRRFERFIKRYHINAILRSVGATKEKGVSVYKLFVTLFGVVFTHKNLYTLLATNRESLPFGKDTVYRFLHRATIRWEQFVSRLSNAVIPEVAKLTSQERRCALVIDDSPYYRNRSQKVELLSRCYDHVEHKYYKGFSLLTLGWTDGRTFIPVDYRIVASGNQKNLLEGSHVSRDKRTLARRRRDAAQREKPALALEMLKAVKGTSSQANYVLFDSWYASPSSILSIKALGYDVVARLKDNTNYRYLYKGDIISPRQIYQTSEKRRGRSRYLLSVMVDVRHNEYIETIPAKIVFVRNKSNRKDWIALISTDISLSEEEIIALYGKRWDIEPFHKILKSCLHLTDEFQLRSFDAITAHAAIVMTRYVFLALENRYDKDDRTIGEIFFHVCEELDDISFAYAFELIMDILEQCLADWLHLSHSLILAFVQQFLASLPCYIKRKLLVGVCES